jgi:uncharacterized protein with HEPN domain
MRDDEALLLDMLMAARKAVGFVDGIDFEIFSKADVLQSAVMREIQVIGEAARMVSEETQSAHPEIEWRAMIGMRNRLVHGYFTIRIDVVWQTLQEDIPPLIARLERIVPEQ